MAIKIPTYDNYQVTSQDAPQFARGVSVNTNFVDPSEGALNAAKAVGAYVDRITEQQDDAIVTDALANLRRKRIDLQFNPDKGFNIILGKDALTPRDENGEIPTGKQGTRSLVEVVDTQLRDYGAELSKNMTPSQLRKFNQHAINEYNSNFNAVMGHTQKQSHDYSVSTYTNALDLISKSGATVVQSEDMGVQVAKSFEDIDENLRKLANIQGWDAQTMAVNRAKYNSAFVSGVVTNMLDLGTDTNNTNLAEDAVAFIKQHSDRIDAQTASKLYALARGRVDDLTSQDISDKAVSVYNPSTYGLVTGGTVASKAQAQALAALHGGNPVAGANALFSVNNDAETVGTLFNPSDVGDGTGRGGITKADIVGVLQNPEFALRKSDGSRYSAKEAIELYKRDPNFARALTTAVVGNRIKERGGDAQTALADLVEGKTTVDKLKAEHGEAWTSYLSDRAKRVLKVYNGQVEANGAVAVENSRRNGKATSLSSTQLYQSPTLIDAQRAVEAVDPTLKKMRPDLYDKTVSRTLKQMTAKYTEAKQASDLRLANGYAMLEQSGGNFDVLPAGLRASLTSTEEGLLRQYGYRVSDSNHVTLYPEKVSALIQDKVQLRGLTQEAIEAYKGETSRSDYAKLYSAWVTARVEAGDDVQKHQAKLAQAMVMQLTEGISPNFSNVAPSVVGSVLKRFESFNKLSKDNGVEAGYIRDALQNAVAMGVDTGELSLEDTKNEAMVNRYLEKKHFFDVFKTTGLFGGGTKTIFEVKASDLSDRAITGGTQVLKQIAKARRAAMNMNQDAPFSDQELERVFTAVRFNPAEVSIWLRNGGNRGVLLSDETVNLLKDNLRAKKVNINVDNLDTADLLRMYLLYDAKGS